MDTTRVVQRQDGTFALCNGSNETVDFWESYEDAETMMMVDNQLRDEAAHENSPDLYEDECLVTWRELQVKGKIK